MLITTERSMPETKNVENGDGTVVLPQICPDGTVSHPHNENGLAEYVSLVKVKIILAICLTCEGV